METKALVDAILIKAENLSRTGGAESVHTLITRCQNKLFSKACSNTVYVDPETGTHPYLPITANVRSYDIPGVQMYIDGLNRDIEFSRCDEIYVLEEDAEEYGMIDMFDGWRSRKWIEKVEERYVIPMHSYERIDGTPARIILKNAPESTQAELYHHISLIRPLPVTDDNIPLMVNDQWHEAIIDGVLGMAEYYAYGRSDRLQTFNDYWCNQFWGLGDRMQRVNQVKETPFRRF